LLGVLFEDARVARVVKFYSDSETDISDFELATKLVFVEGADCDILNEEAKIFADKIYEEARKLEDYDNTNKITDRVIHLHKRYDLLRTSLWAKLIEIKSSCNNSINTVVYFYDYLTEKPDEVSTQKTMSNYLTEFKKNSEEEIILIPIAVDTGVFSTEVLMNKYGVEKIPSILINEKYKIESLDELYRLWEIIG
jgi:hypothetical protein